MRARNTRGLFLNQWLLALCEGQCFRVLVTWCLLCLSLLSCGVSLTWLFSFFPLHLHFLPIYVLLPVFACLDVCSYVCWIFLSSVGFGFVVLMFVVCFSPQLISARVKP